MDRLRGDVTGAARPWPVVNLRSDTQTLPTPEMREAMLRSKLGDDTYREDPTVFELEERAAERLGAEAAMLLLSGTMANLVALMTHCRPSDAVFLDDRAHVLLNEAGGLSGVAGAVPTVVASNRGHLKPSALDQAIREPRVQQPRPRLVWLENTHNRAGGTVLEADGVQAIVRIAQQHGLRTHMDGARLFNASTALGVAPSNLLSGVDSVYVDLTKGLCCPLGALLAGSAAFIEEARRNRQVLGGGMRQAGVIAACGIVALSGLVERLGEDHVRARRLAGGLATINGIRVTPAIVETNIVFADVASVGGPARFTDRLADEGVLVSSAPPDLIRFVTHRDVDDAEIEHAIEACRRAADALRSTATGSDTISRPGGGDEL